jgi:hypothetical protein
MEGYLHSNRRSLNLWRVKLPNYQFGVENGLHAWNIDRFVKIYKV